MTRAFASIGLGIVLAAVSTGQTTPVFDAVDVHVSARSSNPSFRMRLADNGRLQVRSATMVDLIKTAWDVEGDKVLGGPSWLETDRFDVIASAPPSTSWETVRLMLRALLTDRFKLEVHHDDKPIPVYVLALGKGKLQLKQADDSVEPECVRTDTRDPGVVEVYAASCHNATMKMLAERLLIWSPAYFDNPVVDRTGLKGGWDFAYKWNARAQLAAAGGAGISIFSAMEKLGLSLAPQQIPLGVIVVDHVNQKPTDNAPGVTSKLPAMPEEFEVAVVRPSEPDARPGGRWMQPGGRFDIRGATLKPLISFAWDVTNTSENFKGGPPWLESDRFDIVAKAPAIAAGDEDTLRLMLRNLLASRFRLAVHMEDQPVTVYALESGKSKLRKAAPANRAGCANVGATTGKASTLSQTIRCQNATMTLFAEKLKTLATGYFEYPLVDLTGIEGAWDFEVSFTPQWTVRGVGGPGAGPGQLSDPNGSVTIFEALEKQLGLKLDTKKYKMPVLVVDHVEQKPIEN